MSSFYIPQERGGPPATEQAYRELRDHAEAYTGEISRDRRIEGIECRRSGRDCNLRVGELDDGNGQTVSAIIQVGRATFTVHHLGPDPSPGHGPLVLSRANVYAVTDFD